VKVYKKRGHQFGVLEYRFDMPLKGEMGPPGKALPLPAGAKFAGTVILDVCIDGSVADGSMEMGVDIDISGKTKVNNVELKLNMIMKGIDKKTAVELPREKK
jgi:hypothetical protein